MLAVVALGGLMCCVCTGLGVCPAAGLFLGALRGLFRVRLWASVWVPGVGCLGTEDVDSFFSRLRWLHGPDCTGAGCGATGVGQDRHPAHTPACTSRAPTCVRCMSSLSCLCRACLASLPVLVHLCGPGAAQHHAPAPSATPPLLFFFQSLLHHPHPTHTDHCMSPPWRTRVCEALRLRVASCALSSVYWKGRTVCRRVCVRAVGRGERLCCGAVQHSRAPVRWCRRLFRMLCVCVAQARHIAVLEWLVWPAASSAVCSLSHHGRGEIHACGVFVTLRARVLVCWC